MGTVDGPTQGDCTARRDTPTANRPCSTVVHGALDLEIKWLTVFTFSTENWARDEYEVEFLMQFNVDLLERRRDELNDLGVRVLFSGDRSDPRIPPVLLDRMQSAEALTADNTEMSMVFAFNYGGRSEVVDAVRQIARDVVSGALAADSIDEATIESRLYIPDMPEPDLVIRTSGEQRTVQLFTLAGRLLGVRFHPRSVARF